jgi:hypothetical protein
MAKPKLMSSFGEHMKLIQTSTLIGNQNSGKTIDPMRALLKEKQEQFAKIKKIGYNGSNFIAEQTGPQSNYGNLK